MKASKTKKLAAKRPAATRRNRANKPDAEPFPRRKKCEQCGCWFRPVRRKQRFCTTKRPSCRWVNWERRHPRIEVTERGGGRRWHAQSVERK